MSIDLKSLDAFVRIVRHGSFRIAAERLATTQPALSARIAKLEAALGARILDRGVRGVTPTSAGRVLLDYAERLLALRTELLGALSTPTARAGRLRLGVAETIVQTWLAGFLAEVARAYPRLVFEIEVDISPNLRERLIAQDLDMAFLIGPTTTPSLVDLPLCRFELAFLASPTLKLGRRSLPLAALATHPLITFARNTQPYTALVERLALARVKPAQIHTSASVATIARMAIDGLGVALLPPQTVGADLAAGRLERLRVRERLAPMTFVVATPSNADRALMTAIGAVARRVALTAMPIMPNRRVPRRPKA
jgi:DNA-binding transcriptional LysR family regulator